MPLVGWQLAKLCRRQGIEIIDAQSSRAHSLGLWIKRFLPTVVLVVHRRVDFAPKDTWRVRRKYQSNLVDGYVAISKAIESILIGAGIDPSKVFEVRSAIDGSPYQTINKSAAKAKLTRSLGLDGDTPLIGNASAMTYQKDYPALLQALAILKKQGFRFHCVIAGDGPLRTELEKLREQLELDYHVSFLGFVDEVPLFLQALDIFCLSSRTEGLGTVLLEAGLARCATVATATGGIPEVIDGTKTGLLAKPEDPASLAKELQTLLLDKDLRNTLGRQLADHVNKHFSLDAMVDGNVQVYHMLIKTRGGLPKGNKYD